MLGLFKLASRNLRRHLRRTLITASAIAFGLFLLLVGSVVGDGSHRNIVERAVGLISGHLVVQHPDYQKEREVKLAVEHASSVAERLRERYPEQSVVTRMFIGGLLTAPQGSVGVTLFAVEPEHEREVSDLDDKIVEGTYITSAPTDIVLGATLAETLGVVVGDKVVLMVQQAGEMQSQLFRVRGLFRAGAEELDGFAGVIPLGAAQQLLGRPDTASQVAVIFHDDVDLDAEKAAAASALNRPDLVVLTWQEANPEIAEFIFVDDLGMWVMMLLILLIAAIGVLNTMLMSVLERTRELGVMLALGMSRRRLATMVLLEALLLGVLASTLGIVLGVAVGQYFVHNGIDMSVMSSSETMSVAGVPMDLVVPGYQSWTKVVVFTLITLFITVSASLYPVWWTTRLSPVRAMARR